MQLPVLHLPGISGDIRDVQFLCPLIPEDQLFFAVSVKIAEDLVMMLVGAIILDKMPFPGGLRIEIGIGILPPPHFIGRPAATLQQVQIAVTIDIIECASRFDMTAAIVNQISLPLPALIRFPQPDHTGTAPTGNHDIICCIFIDIEYDR